MTSIIERDIAARLAESGRLEPGDLIERVTGGIRFVPDTAVRRVILAPSYFSRPFNWVHSGPDWRLFCYPVADAAIEERDRQAPSAAMIRLYRTLGDESRLRILKLLVDRDMYLTEIAEALGYSEAHDLPSHGAAPCRGARVGDRPGQPDLLLAPPTAAGRRLDGDRELPRLGRAERIRRNPPTGSMRRGVREMANMKKVDFGVFPSQPRGKAASTGAVALRLSSAYAQHAEYRREADGSRLVKNPDPGTRTHRAPRVRVAVGHALVAVGEAIAGCQHALERRPARSVR